MRSAALSSTSVPAHRVCETVVTVTDASGEPLQNAEIVVAQTRHAFGFGMAGGFSVRGSGRMPPGTVLRVTPSPISIGSSIEICPTSGNMFPDPTNYHCR